MKFQGIINNLFVDELSPFKRFWYKIFYWGDEWFDIVDEEGNIVSNLPRTICHNGCKKLHPVVHIHIFNSKNHLLLQKRAKTKKIQPGKWDTSIGGHIEAGESIERAILREAKEELGIDINPSDLKLLQIYPFESSVEREYVHSYRYNYDGRIDFQKEEIDEVRFFSSEELDRLIKGDEVTENFKYEYKIVN